MTVEVCEMFLYAIKVLVSVVIIIAISEISKRNSMAGAVLASLPLVSILGMVWLYIDTGNANKVEMLARNIFWLVLPSLALFICLPWLLQAGVNFWISLAVSMSATLVAYGLTLWLLQQSGR
jgi:hypothetical protein